MEKAPAKEGQLNLHARAPAAPSVEMEIAAISSSSATKYVNSPVNNTRHLLEELFLKRRCYNQVSTSQVDYPACV